MSPLLDRFCGLLLALSFGARSRPRFTLALCMLVTIGLAAGLPRLEVRADGGVLDDASDPEVARALLDRELFGDGDGAVVLVTPADAARLDTPDGLRAVRSLHDAIAALPTVRASGVRSIASIPDLRASLESLSAEAFLDSMPDDPSAFAAWRQRLREHPSVDGQLLAADGSAAALWAPAAFGVEAHELVDTLRQAVDASPPSLRLQLLGPAVAESLLGEAVLDDLARLIPLMVLVLTLGLLWTLRSLGALLVTMLEVGLVLIWSFGAMAWAGRPLTLVTTALPVLLLTLAITDEIHLLERLQAGLARGLAVPDALTAALRRLVRPLTVTTVTTCLALLVFCASELPPLRVFGAVAAFGMAAALLVSLTVVPVAVERLPRRWFRARGEAPDAHRSAAFGAGLVDRVVRRPGLAALVGVGLLSVAVPGLAHLQVGDNWLANFPPDAEIVAADRAFNEHFWGGYHLDLVLEAAPGFFDTAAGAALVERLSERARGDTEGGGIVGGDLVRGVTSYLTPVSVVMAAHGETGPASSLDDLRLTDYIVLAGMSEDPAGLSAFLTADGSAARIRLTLGGEEYGRDRRLLDELEATLRPEAAAAGAVLRFGGETTDGVRMVERIVRSQVGSVLLAYFALAVFALGVAPRGLVGLVLLVPVLAAVAFVFGLMGLAGLHLGVATSMFAGLTVGVGVDFGIHLLAAWNHARRRATTLGESLSAAWAEAGRGVTSSALVLGAGLSVLALSTLRSNRSLGLLLGVAVAASFVFSVTLLPSLLAALERFEARRRRSRCEGGALRVDALVVMGLLGACFLLGLGGATPAAGAPPTAPAASPGSAAAPAAAKADAEARRVMAEIERRFRAAPRLVQLEIDTERPREATAIGRPEREQVELWGVVDGAPDVTSVLFVYAAPRRMRGTGLLLAEADDSESSRMFFHMRTFDRFRDIPRSSLKVRVQGTCLTYEDARGFFSSGKYDFASVDAPGAASGDALDGPAATDGDTLSIVARPRTPELAADLGFDEARLRVDRRRHLLLSADLHDADGGLLRTIEVLEAAPVGDALWLPRRSRVVDHESGVVSRIVTTAWPLPAPPPAALFDRRVDDRAFLARFLRAVDGFGLGSAVERLRAALRDDPVP